MANDSGVARELLAGALELADALNQFRIDYALIGGLAAGYCAHARFTRDVDFLLAIPQVTLPSLLETPAQRGFSYAKRFNWTNDPQKVGLAAK